MPPRRRITLEDGRAAVLAWAAGVDGGEEPARTVFAAAVRFTLQELGMNAPGRTVEVRVPPLGAVQCIEGPVHTRGTPPNVIETDAATWMELATGRVGWREAYDAGRVRASGQRADLTRHLPIVPVPVERALGSDQGPA